MGVNLRFVELNHLGMKHVDKNIKTMKKVAFVLPYSLILALLAYVFYFF